MGLEPLRGAVVAVGSDEGSDGTVVREEVEFFGWPEQMLGCRHGPAVGAAAGVLVCLGAPFGTTLDQGRAARLGRRLARSGVIVQRFQPRGSPPSDGDPTVVGFASLVDDADSALDLLRDRTGVERVGFVGVRLGALVAARLARRESNAPVALWEPVGDPLAMVAQAARARASTRPIDLFDTALCAELIGGAVGDLVDELGERSGDLLVVQTGPGDALVPAYESLVERCRGNRVRVDACCHPCDAEREGTVVPGGPPDALVDTTASWLGTRLVPAAAPPRSSPPGEPGNGTEAGRDGQPSEAGPPA